MADEKLIFLSPHTISTCMLRCFLHQENEKLKTIIQHICAYDIKTSSNVGKYSSAKYMHSW